MNTVTFDDIGLKDITLDSLPRLERLRQVHFQTRPEVCPELASLMTTYMKEMDAPHDSPELRAGKRLKYVLENKKAVIHEDDLLAGTTTSKIKGVPIYPQFLGQALWPELETISGRKRNPYGISQDAMDTLNFDVFPFWMDRTVQEVCRKDYENPFCQRMMERMFFFLATKAHTISHTVPDYEAVVVEGLAAIIEKAKQKESELGVSADDMKKKDFYKAVTLALEGVIDYAERLGDELLSKAERETDPVRKEELQNMSAICARVPKEKSNTFQEALQAVGFARSHSIRRTTTYP